MDNNIHGAAANVYADNNAHRQHNPYKNDDPYANGNPYEKREERERKRPWALDFEILRFFREGYNAGIDFEESPRAFFDEEHMLAIRLKVLGRNFTTMLFKILFMIAFSAISLILTSKGVMIFGFIYIVSFLYFIAVPIGFMKYARQYIIDDTPRGKLKSVHLTYQKWLRPLEVFTMNTLTVFFVFVEIVMFTSVTYLHEKILSFAHSTDSIPALMQYINTISVTQMRISIILVIAFYIIAYILYWFFIYKIWSPKWEAKRLENEKAFSRANQRVAVNLQDSLMGKD